jgi:hypothetical protein
MGWSQTYQDTVHWGLRIHERRSKYSDPTKGEKFLHQSGKYQVLKTDSTRRSSLYDARTENQNPKLLCLTITQNFQ